MHECSDKQCIIMYLSIPLPTSNHHIFFEKQNFTKFSSSCLGSSAYDLDKKYEPLKGNDSTIKTKMWQVFHKRSDRYLSPSFLNFNVRGVYRFQKQFHFWSYDC